MVFTAFKDWFLSLGQRYGVDPVIFGAIYVGAIPFFLWSLAWLVRNARRRHSIIAPALSTGFFFLSAYLYLIAVGRNVPAWVYAAVVLGVAAGAWSTTRSLKKKIRAAGSLDADHYDLIVIGGGAAGLAAAGLGGQLGARTLLVERDRLGGDCTWSGCVPSKALLKAAKVAQLARDAAQYGLTPAELGVDLGKVLARVHEIQKQIYNDADHPEIYEDFGASVRLGSARFTNPHAIELTTPGKPPEPITFRYAIVATGSRPTVPELPGLEQVPYLTNESIFHQKTLPGRLAVLGGGPIGVEMAQAFRRLGSAVTLLQRATHLLPKDDPELTEILRRRLEAEGVVIHLNARVTRVEGSHGLVRLSVETVTGRQLLEADALLVAVGRRVHVESLGLDAAGVRADERGIRIDDRCRTSQKHIYACGDVTGQLQFTHVAEHMAKVAVTNALLGLPLKIERNAIPWVTYTDPEVAHVGVRRLDLERSGRRFRVYRFPFGKIDRAVAQGVPEGWIQVLATPKRGRILGATVVGEGAGEMIAELGLALKYRIPLRKIADTVHAYPTLALGNRRVADQWYVQNLRPAFVRLLQVVRDLHGTVPRPPDPDRIV